MVAAVVAGSCPAEAGRLPPILAHASGPCAPPYAPARRPKAPDVLPGGQPKVLVSFQGFSELLGCCRVLVEAIERRSCAAIGVVRAGKHSRRTMAEYTGCRLTEDLTADGFKLTLRQRGEVRRNRVGE